MKKEESVRRIKNKKNLKETKQKEISSNVFGFIKA